MCKNRDYFALQNIQNIIDMVNTVACIYCCCIYEIIQDLGEKYQGVNDNTVKCERLNKFEIKQVAIIYIFLRRNVYSDDIKTLLRASKL